MRDPDERCDVNEVAAVEAVLTGDQALLESLLNGDAGEDVLGNVCRCSTAWPLLIMPSNVVLMNGTFGFFFDLARWITVLLLYLSWCSCGSHEKHAPSAYLGAASRFSFSVNSSKRAADFGERLLGSETCESSHEADFSTY